jgi:peptide/nickel transport system substrate-binding protein
MTDWKDAPDTSTKLPRIKPSGSSVTPARQKVRWQIVLLGLGLVMIAGSGLFWLLSTPAGNTPSAFVAQADQVYSEALIGEARYVNPILARTQVDKDLASLVFSGLTRVDDYGQPQPDLAQNWQVSEDGLTYTFQLRRDVTWHDGQPFTARDVDFTMALLRDPNFPGPPALGDFWRTVETYIDDDYTVRFILTQPLTAFPELAGVGILPAHWLPDVSAQNLPDDLFNLDPVGTGPLDWVSLEEGGNQTMIRLQPYHAFYDQDRSPGLDELHFHVYDDAGRAYRAVGEDVLGIGGISGEELEAIFGAAWINVYTARLPAYGAVIFNHQSDTRPFFQEPKTRAALVYSLDLNMILSGPLALDFAPTSSTILPGTWAYNPALPANPFDMAQAELLFVEAGWLREGSTRMREGIPLTFTLLVSDRQEDQTMGEAISESWRANGIDVTLEVLSTAELIEQLTADSPTFDAALVEFSLGGIADPDPYPFWHDSQIGRQNTSGAAIREISEAIEIARKDPNGVRRAELYRDYQTAFIEQGAAALIYNPLYHYGISCQVRGVSLTILRDPSDRFRSIADWYIASGDELTLACP